MPRESDWEANELAQIAFGVKMGEWITESREYLENPNKRVPHKVKAQA